MTFLQLVQRLKQECGVSGSIPTTTVGQTGEIQRLVDWVAQSWVEVQEVGEQFDFMRKTVTFNTVAGQQKYAVGTGLDINLSDFASWRNDSVRQYLQTAGVATQIILAHYYDYSEFRDFYLLGSRTLVQGRPLYFTIHPDRSLVFGFIPNDIYVTDAEYFRTPQVLSADADEPICPARFHMGIVYKAMMKYGMFEVANEQIEAGRQGYSMIMNRMTQEYTPIMQVTGSFI